MVNGAGLSALHLATLAGSSDTVIPVTFPPTFALCVPLVSCISWERGSREDWCPAGWNGWPGTLQVGALIQLGANLACQIAGGRFRPVSNWMCGGSTALHLACACGLPAIATLLLDAQSASPGALQFPRWTCLTLCI